MHVDLIAFSNSKLNTPDKLFANPTYPSGIVEGKSTIYQYAYPSSQYPMLLLPKPLLDNDGNSISDGYYIIALSDDKKFLLFIQSGLLKAKIPVFKYEEQALSQEELSEESEIQQRMEQAKLKNKLKKYKQAEEDLKNYKIRINSKMSAEIFDSGRDYFLIKYWRRNQIAWGVISK